MEDGISVVAIEAELQEVAGAEGRLGGEEVQEDVAGGGGKEDLGGGLGFEVVESAHCGPLKRGD